MTASLSSDALRHLAVDGYFGRVVARDMTGLMANIAADATMEIPPLAIAFRGKPDIQAHFEDFLDSYSTIQIDEFVTTADPDTASVAVRFHIRLQDTRSGALTDLHNCNFFHCDDDGRIAQIIIYMSALPTTGFAAGAQSLH